MDDLEQDPGQERRLLIALVLSMAVLFFFAPKSRQQAPAPADGATPVAEATAIPQAPTAPDLVLEPAAAASSIKPTSVDRSWPEADATFSSFGGSPSKLHIHGWQEPFQQDWLPTWLLDGVKAGFKFGSFEMGCEEEGVVDIVQDDSGVLLPVGWDERGIAGDTGHYELVPDSSAVVYRVRRGDVQITKRFSTPTEGYASDYSVEFRNLGDAPVSITPRYGVADRMEQGESRYGPQMEAWADIDGSTKHKAGKPLDKAPKTWEGPVDWFGIGDRYFVLSLETAEPMEGTLVMQPAPGDKRYASVLEAAPFTLAAGEARATQFKMWTGPRKLESLKKAAMRAETSVDFGWFGLLALPILAFLKFIFGLVGNWGISIILLTVTIKGVLFPLTQKSFKSMRSMQALQPEIEKLREKHGDDREALNLEMMGLWKEHNVNPLGGCLPMVLQMPIWFALYRVLWNAVELYQTPFLYFCDLSLRDPIGIFPLLLGVTMYLQQKFTPNTSADPAQQAVIKFMPLFFSVIMFTLPAGLVVYILVNNILSIAQHWLIHRQHGDAKKAT